MSAARANSTKKPKSEPPKKINLALQGGGAHGAFTWGVLDYLLEDSRIGIEGVSGASAGAMNAVMLADGLARGGEAEARRRLEAFWRATSHDGNLPALQRSIVDRLFSFVPFEGSPVKAWFKAMAPYLSPYDLNPLNINPLRDLIERFVDFEAVRACEQLQLFISATNVHTGHVRIFPREKITVDVVMASACLPFMFRAVEICGVPYWDGGYMGNPALFPLFHKTKTEDLLIVQINPMQRRGVPTTSHDIMNRVNEINFNSSLLSELRAIEFVTRLIDRGHLPRGSGPGEYRRVNVHRIALDHSKGELGQDTKLNNDFDFFLMLRDLGRKAAEKFLQDHFEDIGRESTINLKAEVAAEWA